MNDQDARAQAKEEARRTLEELLRLTGFEGKVDVSEPEAGEVLLRIECSDAAALIGRRGQVLDALQFLLQRMLFRAGGRETRFVVDVGGYRERRKEQILRDAAAAVEDVKQTGRPIKLPAMSAAERRLVHHLVAKHAGLETYSEPTEEEGRKRVVIRPAKPSAEPPPGESSSGEEG